MRRFAKNRWWAFILTLSVLVASTATFSSPSYGEGLDPISIGDGGETGGGGTTSPKGDPDGPSGPTKRSPAGRGISSGGNFYAATPVGDGGAAVSVWTWRFHVVLRSLVRGWFQL